jgi:hypothetical protein
MDREAKSMPRPAESQCRENRSILAHRVATGRGAMTDPEERLQIRVSFYPAAVRSFHVETTKRT